MKIHIIESGSKGNATIIENGGRILLIDMGISLTSLKEALNSLNRNVYDIDCLLLTHSHSDHTKGIKYLPPLPIYCTKNTYDAENIIEIKPYESFTLNGVEITPVLASHDGCGDCVGYILDNKKDKVVYLTDTGYIPDNTLSLMKNADYYVIESNHNLKMLYQTNRPPELKARIASDYGHLSNEDSACYICEVIGDKTKEVILAHLSEEANAPEVALKAYEKKFRKFHISLDKIKIKCASQHKMIHGGNL